MGRPAMAVSFDLGTTLALLRSGGQPACRGAGASRPADKTLVTRNRTETFQNRTPLPPFFPVGGTPALYGGRDVCRCNTLTIFSELRLTLPK